jgi:hypothetical protein
MLRTNPELGQLEKPDASLTQETHIDTDEIKSIATPEINEQNKDNFKAAMQLYETHKELFDEYEDFIGDWEEGGGQYLEGTINDLQEKLNPTYEKIVKLLELSQTDDAKKILADIQQLKNSNQVRSGGNDSDEDENDDYIFRKGLLCIPDSFYEAYCKLRRAWFNEVEKIKKLYEHKLINEIFRVGPSEAKFFVESKDFYGMIQKSLSVTNLSIEIIEDIIKSLTSKVKKEIQRADAIKRTELSLMPGNYRKGLSIFPHTVSRSVSHTISRSDPDCTNSLAATISGAKYRSSS